MTEEMIAEDSPEFEDESLESEAPEQEEYEDESLYDDTEAEEAEPEEIDDSEEVNFNDRQYKLPKDIAEGVKSMQKDYTQKTMALADQRRAFQEQVQFQQALNQDLTKIAVIDETLKQFQQLDWNTLVDDTATLNRFMAHRAQLESQKQAMLYELAHKKEQLALHEQQTMAKTLEASEAVLKRDIKDWSPQLESNLQQFAIDRLGFDAHDVKQAKADPRIYKLLHMAFQGNQIMSKQAAKPKAVQQAKPVTTLKAKSTKVTRDPSQMNDAEFAKWRRQQIQRRGA